MNEIDKLDYSILLREKGFISDEITEKMREKGFNEPEILYYLKKSDEIFLNKLIQNRRSKSNGQLKKGVKMIILALSLILLISALFGYTTIGLLGLFIIWSLVGYSSYRK